MQPEPVITASVRDAKLDAERARREALALVADGLASTMSIIESAADPAGEPLRALRVRRLMRADGRFTNDAAEIDDDIDDTGMDVDTIITRFIDIAGLSVPPGKVTVGMIVRPGGGGRRLDAFAAAMPPPAELPWPGFPFAAKPTT